MTSLSQEEKKRPTHEDVYREEIEDYIRYLKSPWRIIWSNFLMGTVRGLGFLLGAALVLAAMGFILKEVLSNIPVVGEFFQALNKWIQESLSQNGAYTGFRN